MASTSTNSKPKEIENIILKGCVLILALSALSLAFRPGRSIAEAPLEEDGYYGLTVSRNMALGMGIVIQTSTWTNGFQPLCTFLRVPVFCLVRHDRDLAIRFILGLDWLFYIGAAYLVSQVACDFEPDSSRTAQATTWAAMILYLSAPNVFIEHFNGMETGCLLACYAVTWRFYQRRGTESTRNRIAFAILLGVLVLARIDGIFLVIIICIHQLFDRSVPLWGSRVGRFSTLAGFSLLVSSPWWLYNLIGFHSLIPSSGKAEQLFGLSIHRCKGMVAAVDRGLFPWVYIIGHEWPYAHAWGSIIRLIALGIVVVCFCLFNRRKEDRGIKLDAADEQHRRTLQFARWLLMSLAVLACWYTVSSHAVHFYARYLAPLALVAVFAGVQLYSFVFQRSHRIATTGLAALVVPIVTFAAMAWRADRYFNGSTHMYIRQQMALVQKYVPADAWVAAGQTGTLGFFRSRVVNLDGKVNGAALRFQHTMPLYLRQIDVDYVCDFPEEIHRYLGMHPEAIGWTMVARESDFELWQFRGITTTGKDFRAYPSHFPLKVATTGLN